MKEHVFWLVWCFGFGTFDFYHGYYKLAAFMFFLGGYWFCRAAYELNRA